jgi:hypothetical protein
MSETRPGISLAGDILAVGEELKGRVVGMPPPGAAVFVDLLWRTTGEERIVAAAEAASTGTHERHFSFLIPAAGPMSYAGQTFSIEWFVRVAKDPSTEKRFTVTAGMRPPEGP